MWRFLWFFVQLVFVLNSRKVESRIRPSVAFSRADGGFHRSKKCFEGQPKSWGGISTCSQNPEIVVCDSEFFKGEKRRFDEDRAYETRSTANPNSAHLQTWFCWVFDSTNPDSMTMIPIMVPIWRSRIQVRLARSGWRARPGMHEKWINCESNCAWEVDTAQGSTVGTIRYGPYSGFNLTGFYRENHMIRRNLPQQWTPVRI